MNREISVVVTLCVFIAVLSASLLLSSCRMPEATPVLSEERMTNFSNITRHYDTQAGVVCWVVDSVDKFGISCLPIDQTELGKE